MQPEESRRSKRIDRTCSVRVKPFQTGTSSGKSTVWSMVTMQNLSASGILFTTTEKLSTGTALEFMISSPMRKEPVYCIGQVVRVEEKQKDKLCLAQITVYSVAAFFKNITADNQEAIKKICDTY